MNVREILLDGAALLSALLWLLGLWKSAVHAFPDNIEGTGREARRRVWTSRKLTFALGCLVWYATALLAVNIGVALHTVIGWFLGFAVVLLIRANWSRKDGDWRPDLSIQGGGWSSPGLREAGAPIYTAYPHWMFHSPALSLIGFFHLVGGAFLSLLTDRWPYVTFTVFGAVVLILLKDFVKLDGIRVMHDRLLISNGFSTGNPLELPITRVTSMELTYPFFQALVSVGTVELKSDNHHLHRISLKRPEDLETAIRYAQAKG